jgi:hypothetical protein
MGNKKGIEEHKGSQKKMKEVDELKSIDQSNQMQIARSLALPVSSDHKCQDTGVTGVTFGVGCRCLPKVMNTFTILHKAFVAVGPL